VARGVEDCKRADHDQPREVRRDHHRTPRQPVRKRAADQECREEADRLRKEDDPELRRADEGESPPAEGGEERRVPDQ